LNGTCQKLVYADDINLLGDGINTIKENRGTLLEASRDVVIEINAEKTSSSEHWTVIGLWYIEVQNLNKHCTSENLKNSTEVSQTSNGSER